MRFLRASVLLSLIVASFAACASTGGSSGGRDFNYISPQEIAEVELQVNNLYDLVQRLRPRWLTVRGDRSFGSNTEVVVYQDQSFLGSVSSLRNLDPGFPHSLTYLDASQAVAQLPGLGSRSVEGAIVINTRPRDR